jgi:hypothetical protein
LEIPNYYKITSIVVGALFISATVFSIMSGLFFGSVYEADYLSAVAANENQVLFGVILLLTALASVVAIPIAIFPILRRHNESLALGYVGARIFEGFFFAVGAISLLSLVSLSREFVNAGSPVASYFQTSGALLIAQFNWSGILLDFPFTLSALILNYVFYKSKLIPQWLAGLGLVGGGLWLATVPFRLFDLFPQSLEFLAIVIAAQEMILATWLIIKGFKLGQ